VANEKTNGAPNGHRAPPSQDELRRDETAWVARLHRDAADIWITLAERSGQVSSLVDAFGPADCREIRLELRRLTRYSIRLVRPQFADLTR